MGSRLFNLALNAFEKGAAPGVRKVFWRGLYNLLARFWSDRTWRFMNYGYLPPDGAAAFPLDAADEPDRAFIGLYHHVVDGLPVAGARVLEVGSGRGGGAAYVARYHQPAEMIGLDYAPPAVRLAAELNAGIANLRYQQGDAEKLPFPDASFDIVINVESSHCYANMAAFVEEVARVLKPGGWFSWVDMRAAGQVEPLDRLFDRADWTREGAHLISPGVVRALDMVHDRKMASISRVVPFARRFMREFAGTKGSLLYRGLKGGQAVYLSRRFRKAGG